VVNNKPIIGRMTSPIAAETDTKAFGEPLSKREQMKLDKALKIFESQEVLSPTFRIPRFIVINGELCPTVLAPRQVRANSTKYPGS
jgi:hypothetical protein